MNTNDPSAHSVADPIVLSFLCYEIQVFIDQDRVPLFALADIEAAFGRTIPTRVLNGPAFPSYGKRTLSEETEQGFQDITMLAPTGVWFALHLTDAGRGQRLAAWVKKQSRRLFPDADPKDPAMFLTIGPRGEMPPRPLKYSGRLGEWHDLYLSDERLRAIGRAYPRSAEFSAAVRG